MKLRVILILVNLVLVLSCNTEYDNFTKDYSKTNKDKISVEFTPSVELLSIIFHYAGNDEYNYGMFKSYEDSLDSYFKSFSNDTIFDYARKLNLRYGIGYNAPMDLAVYFDNDLTPITTFDSIPDKMDTRWRMVKINEFVDLIKQFKEETLFLEFYNDFEKSYEDSKEEIHNDINKKIDFNWFRNFFNYRNNAEFKIILSLINSPNNYAARTCLDGKTKFYAFIGPYQSPSKKPILYNSHFQIIVHEFCHSYCNTIVSENQKKIDGISKSIWEKYNKGGNCKFYYNQPEIVMNESLVRACVVCYLKSHNEEYDKRFDENEGFPWIEELSENIMENYVNNDEYKSFDEYLPEIVSFFEEYLEE